MFLRIKSVPGAALARGKKLSGRKPLRQSRVSKIFENFWPEVARRNFPLSSLPRLSPPFFLTMFKLGYPWLWGIQPRGTENIFKSSTLLFAFAFLPCSYLSYRYNVYTPISSCSHITFSNIVPLVVFAVDQCFPLRCITPVYFPLSSAFTYVLATKSSYGFLIWSLPSGGIFLVKIIANTKKGWRTVQATNSLNFRNLLEVVGLPCLYNIVVVYITCLWSPSTQRVISSRRSMNSVASFK